MNRTSIALVVCSLTIVSVALAGAIAFGPVGADTGNSPPTTEQTGDSTIDVSAVGEITAEPDTGVVHVTLSVAGDDIEELTNELAADAEALRDELDSVGVAYETTSYRVGESWFRNDERRHDYDGHHSFKLTTDDPDRVGPAIDAAAGVGAEITSAELTLSDAARAEYRDAAIEDAMDNARSQAETIAAVEGLSVAHPATVDASQRMGMPYRFETAEETVDGEAVPTEIDGGDLTITYEVAVTYTATA